MAASGEFRCGSLAKGLERHKRPLAAVGLNAGAGKQRLGLMIERAQQLALPAVPDARADGADVGDGQHQQQLQALGRANDVREIADGLGIADIARLRIGAHDEMLLDQPYDHIGLARGQAQTRSEPAGDGCTDDGMILFAPLADVVQEGGQIERAAILDGLEKAMRERVDLVRLAALDLGDDADGADQMLVQRVVVIHVELHHGDDAPEVGNEPAEHAGLVHAPQRGLDVAAGKQSEENAIGLGIVAQTIVDQPQRLTQQAHGGGMKEGTRLLGQGEEANEVDRDRVRRRPGRQH